MKLLLPLLASVAFSASCVTDAMAQTKIQVATAPSIYQKSYEAIIAAFEAKHPDIDVDLIPAKREDEELVQTTLRNSITGDIPDVLFVSPNLMRPLIDRKLAKTLDEVGITQDDLSSAGVISGTRDLGVIGGKAYGVPFGVSTPVIAYNASLVEAAGVDPSSFPKTWPDATKLAIKIGENGDGNVGGFFEYDNTGNWTYKALVASLGGRMMSQDEKTITFGDATGLEAFNILRDFGTSGQAKIDMTRDQARQAFAAGKIGMIVTSSGALSGLEKLANGAFELRAAPLPLGGENGRIPAAGTVMMVLAKDEAKQKAAAELIKFADGVEAQTLMGTQTGLLSVNEKALSDPQYLGDLTKKRPNAQAALDQLPRLTEWYSFPGENSLKITEVIKSTLQRVLTHKQEPQEALETMKTDVQKLLTK